MADTSLLEPFPTNNLGGANILLVGTGENLQRHRALLKFDIAGQLPPNAKIKSAALVLELAGIPSNGYEISGMGLHRLLRKWGEGDKLSPTNCGSCLGQGSPASTNEATWLEPTGYTNNLWSTPGAAATNDYIASASASQTIYQFADSPYYFGSAQLAVDVQFWLDNPTTNHGWIIICHDESVAFTARRFFSRDHASFPPYLAVEFIVPPVIENPRKIGGQFSFEFTAIPGQSYIIESRGSSSTGAWQTVANAGYFAETNRVFIVDQATVAQRFYRVGTR